VDIRLLNQMRHGNLILVDDGAGIANLIHVSDAAVLVIQVLERSGSPFEISMLPMACRCAGAVTSRYWKTGSAGKPPFR